MSKKQKTNFTEILEYLRPYRVSDYVVASFTKVKRSTITKVRLGELGSFRYDDGCKIVALYNALGGDKYIETNQEAIDFINNSLESSR